jgi:hypothetical protein
MNLGGSFHRHTHCLPAVLPAVHAASAHAASRPEQGLAAQYRLGVGAAPVGIDKDIAQHSKGHVSTGLNKFDDSHGHVAVPAQAAFISVNSATHMSECQQTKPQEHPCCAR